MRWLVGQDLNIKDVFRAWGSTVWDSSMALQCKGWENAQELSQRVGPSLKVGLDPSGNR